MKKAFSCVWLALILILTYVPILIIAVYSFTDASMVGGHISSFSFENYANLFKNEELRSMIIGTVLLAVGSALLATVIATFGAIGAHYSRKIPKSIVNTLNQVPVVNADVVTGFSVCVLLIILLGIGKDTYIPLVIGHVVLCAPFVYLSIIPKLKQLDNNLYEAALDLGATPEFFRALCSR